MKLKYISLFVSILFLTSFIFSCSDNTANYVDATRSADAQVYSFSITGTPINDKDSTNYPIMAKTAFVIDQLSSQIYNADSLPYQTKTAKFALSTTFSASSPSRVDLIYSDTVINWNTTDSVDFTKKFDLKITAQNGTTSKQYKLDLRIHQIDPDTLVWLSASSLPNNIGNMKAIQKKDGKFYCFSNNGSQVQVYTSNNEGQTWTSPNLNGLPTSVLTEYITLFNDTLYAIDRDEKAYISGDGINWETTGGNAYAILGILPGASDTADLMLVIQKLTTGYVLATTKDLKSFDIVSIKGANVNTIYNLYPEFPVSGFSSNTNYDRKNLNSNILFINGGKGYDGLLKNTTWLLRSGNTGIEIAATQKHSAYEAQAGNRTFLYDDKLYTLAQDSLYTSNWGEGWEKASAKEVLSAKMGNTNSQSILVDKNNYIWVFGGISGSNYIKDVWKGRINRLNK